MKKIDLKQFEIKKNNFDRDLVKKNVLFLFDDSTVQVNLS